MNKTNILPLPAMQLGTALGLLFLSVSLGLFFWGWNSPVISSFMTVFAGIVLEALPFMLLGSMAGGLIEVFVSREKLLSRLPKKNWQMIIASAAFGLLCPVCECAVVPVAKRLLGKGVPVPAVIAFLLGAPLVNPIVGLSTAVAYSFNVPVAMLRLLTGYVVAVAAALIIGRIYPGRSALIPETKGHHIHSHTCGCGDSYHLKSHRSFHGLMDAFRHASADFMAVGQFLVAGAFIAALFQTVVPQQRIAELSSNPVSSILLMMALAIGLNICSEADAFVAASFQSIMPFSSQFAFLLLGPMLDIKLILMYLNVFRRKAIAELSICIFILVFVCACCLQYLAPGGLP